MNLLVLGKPSSGKTSWCSKYIGWLRRQGLSVGGILCPEIHKHGEHTGFNAIDLLTGEEMPFARLSRDRSFKKGERVGDYTISKRGILFACNAIEKAVENRCDLVIVDEVGPLELRGKGLMPATELALASTVNVLIIVRSSLKEALQQHFPKYEFTVIADLSQSPPSVSKRAKWLLPLAHHLVANCNRWR